MINLVTVCTDAYPIVYAEKLHKRFSELTNLQVRHFCLTDRPHEVGGWATPIDPFIKSTGWWNKINVYHREMPAGFILYMDLDIVLLKNFDREILFMQSRAEAISCVSDAIGWHGVQFSSSLMGFESGVHHQIFEAFQSNSSKLLNFEGGDQVWTGPQLDSIYFVDRDFPNLKKNLKFHLATREGNNYKIPTSISEDVKLVDCGGRPKPHELSSVPYIKSNWHDIR